MKFSFPLTSGVKRWLHETRGVPMDQTDLVFQNELKEALAEGALSPHKLRELVNRDAEANRLADAMLQKADAAMKRTSGEPSLPEQVMSAWASGGEDGVSIPGVGSFSTVRQPAVHVKTGKPVCPDIFGGKPAAHPSEFDLAKAGAFLKWTATKAGLNTGWTDTDAAMFRHVIEQDSWGGLVGNQWKSGLRGSQVKALLDGTTSGGTYISPEWFDNAVITKPLLHGELVPYVDLVPVPRGSSVEGAAISTPSVVWGTSEGTSQELFDTTGLVSQISASVYSVAVFLEVGRDLMADSLVNVGSLLVELIAERFLAELDDKIANGTGSSQIEGLFNASAGTTVSSENGTSGPLTLDDFEALSFGIAKQYRVPAWNPSFIMCDTTYRRARQLAVGAADSRRLLGLNHSEYRILEWPARVQNDIPQTKIAFMPLRKYRLWRRQGLAVQWSTEGQTLMRKNTALLAVRARYAGKVVDSDALAVMTDAPATDG